jgi:hypothetical protein
MVAGNMVVAAAMSSQVRWILALLTVLALILAGGLYYFTQPVRPPLPSEQVERRRPPSPVPQESGVPNGAGVADPAGLTPSAQNELNCVDRLLQRGAAEGVDLKAEWDRCAALGEAGQNQMMPGDPQLERDPVPARGGAENGTGRPR